MHAPSPSLPLFYFSGTGNTWWASQRLAEALSTRGLNTRAYSIEQFTPDQTAELIVPAPAIGLGFPIYGSDAPRIFHEFIATLPAQSSQKDVLGYVTQMAWSGDGINFLFRPLLRRGYRLRWAIELNMPNNICLDIFPLPYHSEHERFKPELARTAKRIEQLAERVAGGQVLEQPQPARLPCAALQGTSTRVHTPVGDPP